VFIIIIIIIVVVVVVVVVIVMLIGCSDVLHVTNQSHARLLYPGHM